MKKLLLATLLVTGLTAILPSAHADCHERVFVGYDRCGNPVFTEVYRPRPTYYEERPAYQPYYQERPSYGYSAPREVRYSDHSDNRSHSKKKKQCDTREPRFRSPLSFIFGF